MRDFYGKTFYRKTFLWRKILGRYHFYIFGIYHLLHHFYTIFLPLLCLPW